MRGRLRWFWPAAALYAGLLAQAHPTASSDQAAPAAGQLAGTTFHPPQELGALASIAPDGRTAVGIVRTGNLVLWDLRTGGTDAITSFTSPRAGQDEGALWSPDGRRIAFVRLDVPGYRGRRLVTVDRHGNDMRDVTTIADEFPWVRLLGWSPDGSHLAIAIARAAGQGTIGIGQIALVSLTDGSLQAIQALDGYMPSAAFSTDGRWLVYDFRPTRDSVTNDVAVVALGTSGQALVPVAADPDADETLVTWLPDGRIVFASARGGVTSLHAVRVAGGNVSRPAALLSRDVGGLGVFGTTSDGRVLISESRSSTEIYLATLDRISGKAQGSPTLFPGSQPHVNRWQPAWSPDGTRLAFVQKKPGQAEALAIQTAATGSVRTYAVGVRNIDHPLWAPDGRAFLFEGTGANDQQRMFQLDLQSGTTTVISDCACFVQAISPDGAFYYQLSPPLGFVRRNVKDGTMEVVADQAERQGTLGSTKLSPDGKWFAFFTRAQPGRQTVGT